MMEGKMISDPTHGSDRLGHHGSDSFFTVKILIDPPTFLHRQRQSPLARRGQPLKVAMCIPYKKARAMQGLQPSAGPRILTHRHQPEAARPKRPVGVRRIHRRCRKFSAFGAKTNLVTIERKTVADSHRVIVTRDKAVAEFRPQKIDLPPPVRRQPELRT